MRNKTEVAPAAKNIRRKRSFPISFQKFNGVFRANISKESNKQTFAYGESRLSAMLNASKNYRIKYLTSYFNM